MNRAWRWTRWTLLSLQPLYAVALGLSLGLVFAWVAGESPWNVLAILYRSAFGSPYDFGMTLFYATPLIFTGLSVAIAFHAGLFNIGAEGQLTLGALAAATTGILWSHLPAPFAPIMAGLAGFLIGGAWGFVPGWLRAKRGSHEVINTIMLNFVAAGLASYVCLYPLDEPASQNPETLPVGASYLLEKWSTFQGAPFTWAFFLALLVAFLIWVLLWKTIWGFELRAVGQSEAAARAAGVDPAKFRMSALALAGGVAGLAGVSEVLGNTGRFVLGFSPDYGFIGIAVALLGRNRPLGVVASALLFGALHKGATALDFETDRITKDLSLVLQAFVILSVCADGIWDGLKRRKRQLADESLSGAGGSR